MPFIRLTCPACDAELELNARHVGQEVDCGQCLQPFVAELPRRRVRATPAGTDDGWDEDSVPRSRRPHRGYARDISGPPRSRSVYILLALFFGGLGVHNFYAGRTVQGAAQFILWLLSWPLMLVFVGCITIFLPSVWALVDVMAVDTDGNGQMMI